MTSTRFIYRAAIALLWGLALWHSWVCRDLFIDGSKLLIDIVQQEWFITFRAPRRYAEIAGQIPVILAVRLGIDDLHRLAQIQSFGHFLLPTLFYGLALWRARNDPVLLATVLAAIAIVFMTTSFFIMGEYNTTYALTVLSAAWLATTDRLHIGEGIALAAIALLFSRTYEVTLYLGPLLAVMTLWRIYRSPSHPAVATLLHIAAAVFFFSGMVVAIESLIDPFDPERVGQTWDQAPWFWQNMQFDLTLAAALALIVWTLVKPAELERRRPYAWAGLFLALLALSPLLALTDTMVRPLARTHYLARTVCGLVVAGIVTFIWAYCSEIYQRVPAFALLHQPGVARRFLRFGWLMLLASVPADVFLTATWVEYLDTLRATVRSHTGVVAFEETPLSHRPSILLVENWALPSQSLAVRSKPGDAVVAPPRDFREWTPFPPERAPDLGRFYWRD